MKNFSKKIESHQKAALKKRMFRYFLRDKQIIDGVAVQSLVAGHSVHFLLNTTPVI